MLTWIWTLLGDVAADVARTVATTWPFLALSIVAAAAVATYVGTDRLEALLRCRDLIEEARELELDEELLQLLDLPLELLDRFFEFECCRRSHG